MSPSGQRGRGGAHSAPPKEPKKCKCKTTPVQNRKKGELRNPKEIAEKIVGELAGLRADKLLPGAEIVHTGEPALTREAQANEHNATMILGCIQKIISKRRHPFWVSKVHLTWPLLGEGAAMIIMGARPDEDSLPG